MKLLKLIAVFLLVAALLIAGVPTVFAVSAPTVQTLKPTRMYLYYSGGYSYSGGEDGHYQTEDVRARLCGSVNPNGNTCTVYFEYGTTTTYGSAASVGTISGRSAVSVSADLTDLCVAALYHCRLVAVSDSGTAYGQDLTFIPSCDSYEVNYLGSYHDRFKWWNDRFIPSADPVGNIEIVASANDDPNWTFFDITNHNPFDVTVDYSYYSYGQTHGNVIIGSMQVQQIYVPKGSICAFAYNYTLFKQVLTNDQYWYETPLPRNKIEMYFLGSLANRQAGMYSINNRNTQAVTLDLQTGSDIYPVTVPAGSKVYFLAPSGYEVMATMHDDPENPFMVISPLLTKWHGAAWVTAEPLGFDDTTAAFELQNNDDTTHSVKLKNAAGVTHAYTLAPYEHRLVTVEKNGWDIYMQLSPMPQPDITGWVEDGYVKINSVSPAASVCPLRLSASTAFMGTYGNSDSSLYVAGGGAFTAVSDKPWLIVTPASGISSGRLTLTAEDNLSASSRSAVVTVSDGTTTKTVTLTQTGRGRGNALSFDGADDCVTAPDNDGTILDAFTIETWVKWNPDASGVQFLCAKNTEQMEIHTTAQNGLRFIPTAGVYLDSPAGVLPTGVWTHIAVVYKPSEGLAKMYIDGDETTLTNNGPNPVTSSLTASDSAFYIGVRGNGSYGFKGVLDDFCVWSRALSQEEIRQSMMGLTDPAAQTGMVSEYTFNQGTAEEDNAGVTVLIDEAGSYNGSLSGFALIGASSNWVKGGASTGYRAVTVSADPALGGTVGGGGVYYEGSQVTLTASAGSGYAFTGWVKGGVPVSTDLAYSFTVDKSDVALTARFAFGKNLAVKTVGDTKLLMTFSAGADLFTLLGISRGAYGALPSVCQNGTIIAPRYMAAMRAVTGQTTLIFPASAGVGTDPLYAVIAGDCCGDGAVNVIDADRALAAAVKAYAFVNTGAGQAQKQAADVNGDGVIDALDAFCVGLAAFGHTTLE